MSLVAGRWLLAAGRWFLVAGHWLLASGRLSVVSCGWFLVSGYSGRHKYVPLHHVGVHRNALRAGMKPAPTPEGVGIHSEQNYDNYSDARHS